MKLFRKSTKLSLILLIVLLLLLSGCNQAIDGIPIKNNEDTTTVENNLETQSEESKQKIETTAIISDESIPSEKDKKDITILEGNLEVHFIDVGQADSILVKVPSGESMLIDAGNNADSDLIYSYLKDQDVKTIDVVIGTHPHEDHIGSLDTVINKFDVEKVYMPKVSANTKTFKDVLLAIKNKGLKITTPVPEDTFTLGQAKCTIVAPNSSEYDSVNNYSVILKLEYGNTSFLFTGDAEDISENEVVDKKYDVKADVLKVGHHGSSSSTTDAFLNAVSPKYAVISCGTNNKYGHPHKETIKKLEKNKIAIYRTDKCGTVICNSDGENITFANNPANYTYTDENDVNTNDSTGIIIENIDKKAEIVIIKNNTSEDINLKGWKLVSVKGNQQYVFPDYTLKAGANVTTVSGDKKGDLTWGKVNVWNNSKSDPGELYDNSGKLIFRYND